MYRKIASRLDNKEEWSHKEFRKRVSQFGITKQESTRLLMEMRGYNLLELKNKKIYVLQAPKSPKGSLRLEFDPHGPLKRLFG